MKKEECGFRKNMYVNPDRLVRMIYGMDALLEALNHKAFQNGMRNTLRSGEYAGSKFFNEYYPILTGSIELMSGAVALISEGLSSGYLDLDTTED